MCQPFLLFSQLPSVRVNTIPTLQMRFREVKKEFACKSGSQGLNRGLSTAEPIVVLFCQDALEKSQALRLSIALPGDEESPSFIYPLIHSNNIDVPGMRDSGGNDPALS